MTLVISYKSSRHKFPKAFRTWGLDLAGPIHLPLNGYIRVFATTKQFIKWAEANSLKKAMGVVIANSIKEHIIRRFSISHRITSYNNLSHSYQFSEASPMKYQETNELSYYPSMVRPYMRRCNAFNKARKANTFS